MAVSGGPLKNARIVDALIPLVVPIADLHTDPSNARRNHAVDRIAASLAQYGQRKPIVVNRAQGNKVEAGNGTLLAAISLGWTEIAVVFVDDDAATAAGYGIADNRVGEFSEWDFDVLAEIVPTLDGFMTGFTDAELANLLPKLGAGHDTAPLIDQADQLATKWNVEDGQLWRLGNHRLIVGDSTNGDVIRRLFGDAKVEMVWTDPPYGVAVGDKNKYLNSVKKSNRIEENLENDTLDEDGLEAMLAACFDNVIAGCKAGAAWYVAAPQGPLHLIFGRVLRQRGIWRQTIQWVKNNATFSPMGVCYHWQAEPVFFGWLPNGGHRFYGGRKQTTVWEIDRPSASPEHPTMKPLELVARAVENSSLAGEVVCDPFVGSGTTIIACENLGRHCLAAEIAPGYAAVVIERWATHTGGVPERIE